MAFFSPAPVDECSLTRFGLASTGRIQGRVAVYNAMVIKAPHRLSIIVMFQVAIFHSHGRLRFIHVLVYGTDQAAEIEDWSSSMVDQDGDSSPLGPNEPTAGQIDTSGSESSALDASLAVEEAHGHLLQPPATILGKVGFGLSLPLLVRRCCCNVSVMPAILTPARDHLCGCLR